MIERYSRPEMGAIWSDRARYETWLEVELAACRAMERVGDVPKGTADSVVDAGVVIDADRIAEIEAEVHHDVIAFLTHVEQQAGEPARWLHLGLTSSDVLDTALALQLGRAGRLILEGIERLLDTLRERAMELRDLPMIGRTHGMHAEPTSVGLVFAGYHAEMQRGRERFAHALEGVAVGKIAGAVGVYGNVTPPVEQEALEALGLSPETVATQVVARDRHAAYFAALAVIAGGIERFSVQVRNWQRSEVGEASEPFRSRQKGSSAMPHKRNPILSENLCGLARLIRSYADAATQNIALWHERDISHSSVERVIAPDATTLVDFMLARITKLLGGLVVDEQRLAANLDASGGLVFSEAVLLELVRSGMARQVAYERVQRCAMAALRGEGQFRQLLGVDPVIAEKIGAEKIDSCFDLKHHLRHVDTIYARVFGEEKKSS